MRVWLAPPEPPLSEERRRKGWPLAVVGVVRLCHRVAVEVEEHQRGWRQEAEVVPQRDWHRGHLGAAAERLALEAVERRPSQRGLAIRTQHTDSGWLGPGEARPSRRLAAAELVVVVASQRRPGRLAWAAVTVAQRPPRQRAWAALEAVGRRDPVPQPAWVATIQWAVQTAR